MPVGMGVSSTTNTLGVSVAAGVLVRRGCSGTSVFSVGVAGALHALSKMPISSSFRMR